MKKTVFYILLMVFLGGFRSYSADLRATGDVSIQYKENGLEGDKGKPWIPLSIFICVSGNLIWRGMRI